jgi:hypothetical protein
MIILGLNAFHADSSAALVQNGKHSTFRQFTAQDRLFPA